VVVKVSLFAVVLYFLSPIAIAKIQNKVIYGDDGRVQFFQVERPEVREVADSTAAMIRTANLQNHADGKTAIAASSFKQAFGVCSSEPFANEPAGALCSAFLVGDDMIATAGHCVNSGSCADSSFVFTYRMSVLNLPPSEVETSEVYHCKEVLENERTDAQDYALVRLDRAVQGHRVLRLSQMAPQVGDGLFVVGHPSGIPTKVAGGANVRSVSPGFFRANLDTYGGNSGSAVFNESTLEVEGILVRGESDFVYDSLNQCSVSYRCPNGACRGEDVTLISYIAAALKKH
jgi:V8-like Glu-specific endopeptidase